jgi:hypothetical protein
MTSKPLQHFPPILAALHKARVSRSDPVLMFKPNVGMHKNHHDHIDADLLMSELLMAIPQLSGEEEGRVEWELLKMGQGPQLSEEEEEEEERAGER